MKKIINISLLALAAAAAISCSKEQIAQNADLQIFTAFGPDSKTVLSGTSILWENGDAIQIYNGADGTGAAYTTTLAAPSAQAEFTGSGAQKLNDKYYAFYPASAFLTEPKARSFSAKYVYFGIPKEQTAVNGKLPASTNVMFAASETTTFNFKHCAAFIKFKIDGTSPAVKQVTFVAPDSKVSGTFRVTLSSMKIGTYNLEGSANYDYVCLKSADGNALAVGEYYMAVNAAEYEKGVQFAFSSTDGKVAVKKIESSQTLAAGDLMDLGTVKINASEFVDPYSKVSTAYLKGNDKGVIFWVNPANPIEGKIVSGWASSDKIKYVSDATITAFSEKPSCKNEEGNVNIANIKATDTYKNSIKGENPAVWAFDECEKEANGFQDGGWYVPSINELKLIYGAVNGMDYASSKAMTNKTAITRDPNAYTKFNNALVEAGGATGAFAEAQYYLWTSELNNDATKASYVRFNDADALPKYYTSNNEFNKSCVLRCVKKVEITY